MRLQGIDEKDRRKLLLMNTGKIAKIAEEKEDLEITLRTFKKMN